MAPFLASLLGIIPNAIGTIADAVKHKRELKAEVQRKKVELVQQAQADTATWEVLQVKGSMTSWKDEFWTVVFGYILLSPIWNPEHSQIIFQSFGAAPEWFQWCVLIAVGASFGVKLKNGISGK